MKALWVTVTLLFVLGAAFEAQAQVKEARLPGDGSGGPVPDGVRDCRNRNGTERRPGIDLHATSAVMVMGRHGYESVAKGTNGFLCLVERGWTAGREDPNFWNPQLRGPICFNAASGSIRCSSDPQENGMDPGLGCSKAQMFE